MAYPKGKKKSEESKRKTSLSCKKFWTDERKEERQKKYLGSNNPFYGKTHTKETKEKLKHINLGKKYPIETRNKVSKSLIGNKRALGNTFSLTYEQRKHLSEIKKGKKCHWWKGGITPINKLIRSSFEYKNWRNKVFERDNWTCVICKKRNGNGKAVYLEADHKKPFAYYKKLRFDINNGRTLCKSCHIKTETFAYKINNL